MDGLTRRRFVGATTAAVAGIAGCSSAPTESGTGETNVAASFFVLGDFTSAVVGDAATAETLVPVGQHGHGWRPDASVHRDAVESDAFVYVGEGFQPWADDVVENVRAGDSDTAVISVRDGVDLLEGDASAGGQDPDQGSEATEHRDGDGDDHDHSEGHHDHGEDGHDHSEDGHDEENGEDDHDHGEDDGDGDAHHHGDGSPDPHFWLDPRRAATAVEVVRDGLRDADPENADAYEANAAEYVETLRDLDDRFADALADASRETVLVAGHDAYGYLAERYGFEVEALTGISPDDEPTSDDVRRAQSIVAEHDLSHVLAPVLESDRAARELVADTDAEEVLPITALPGIAPEWADRDWGYVEIQENVNLPSLRTALGAR